MKRILVIGMLFCLTGCVSNSDKGLLSQNIQASKKIMLELKKETPDVNLIGTIALDMNKNSLVLQQGPIGKPEIVIPYSAEASDALRKQSLIEHSFMRDAWQYIVQGTTWGMEAVGLGWLSALLATGIGYLSRKKFQNIAVSVIKGVKRYTTETGIADDTLKSSLIEEQEKAGTKKAVDKILDEI